MNNYFSYVLTHYLTASHKLNSEAPNTSPPQVNVCSHEEKANLGRHSEVKLLSLLNFVAIGSLDYSYLL